MHIYSIFWMSSVTSMRLYCQSSVSHFENFVLFCTYWYTITCREWWVLYWSKVMQARTGHCSWHVTHCHHKHQGLDPLIHSVSRVTAACANASLVFQFFSFLVVCSGMISKGFAFVAFFASVKASSVCIHLSCIVCL